jgi:pSer/pThr/pTyr-binding forkhead associated (FHA) protein
LGSGEAKLNGLTLQIEGAGLSAKHAQLKFDGFKNFDVLDYGSENGTWMNIPKEGVDVKDGEYFTIGPFVVFFTYSIILNEIE